MSLVATSSVVSNTNEVVTLLGFAFDGIWDVRLWCADVVSSLGFH